MKRSSFLAALLIALTVPLLTLAGPIAAGDTVLLRLTEDDLNEVLRSVFHERGHDRLAGERHRPSRGLHDLQYFADLTRPTLDLGSDGRIDFSVRITDAGLSIGKLERRVLARRMSCEGLGAELDPRRPVRLDVTARFSLNDGELRVDAENVSIDDPRAFRLKRPRRCRNAWLPTRLMWWIGRPRLERRLDGLDRILLDKARERAQEIRLVSSWSGLEPRILSTADDALLLRFAAESDPVSGPPAWLSEWGDGSFIAISERWVDRVVVEALAIDEKPRRGGKNVRRLLRSNSSRALFPGLAEVSHPERISFAIRPSAPPRVDFEDGPDGLRIRIELPETVIELSESAQPLGALHIDSATLVVAPYPNPIGGFSLRLVENRWELSSSGIEIDDELVAATLEELAFGAAFETTYEPLARDTLLIGGTGLTPRALHARDGYLVVDLGNSQTKR